MGTKARARNALSKTGNLQCRNSLVVKYQKFVHDVTARMIAVMGLPVRHREEYISAGYLGLVEAAQRFDPEAGTQFEAYAYLRIRGAIIDSIRAQSELSGKAYRLARAMQAIQSLREEEHRVASPKASGVIKRSHSIDSILDFAVKGALAYKLGMTEGREGTTEDYPGDEHPEAAIVSAEKRRKIRKMVATLPEKERIIVEDFYFNDKSFKEIAEEHEGFSKSWVSRLHSRALDRLKGMYVAAEGLEGS